MNPAYYTNMQQPHLATWGDWPVFYNQNKNRLIPQASRYNKVFLDDPTNVYYKWSAGGLDPELIKKLTLYNTTPGPFNAEAKALEITNKLGLTVPKEYSFVSPADPKALFGESCLAMSGMNGTPVKDIMKNPNISPAYKMSLVPKILAKAYPLSFMLADIDHEANNMFLMANSTKENPLFGHSDFRFAFSNNFAFQEQRLRIMYHGAKKNPKLLPEKELMQENFFSMIQRVDQNKHKFDAVEFNMLHENLYVGYHTTMELLYS